MMSASFSPDVNQEVKPLVTLPDERVCLLLHDKDGGGSLFIHINKADAAGYFRKLATAIEKEIAKADTEAAAVPLTIADLQDLSRPGPLAVTVPDRTSPDGAAHHHIDLIA